MKFVLFHLDDDVLEGKQLKRILSQSSEACFFEVFSFTSPKEFLASLEKTPQLDFVLLDIFISNHHEEDGVEYVHKIKKLHKNAIVVMSSNLDDPTTVLRSLRAGAHDFISKKQNYQDIANRLIMIRESIFLRWGFRLQEGRVLAVNQNQEKIVGGTLKRIAYRVPYIISSAITTIYVEGPSGTGKEVVADLFQSHLAENTPFIRLNCGSISPSLLESELFGYAKGAFTGALHDKIGVIEAANWGWLFLDEVASLSMAAQTALLRALENQEIQRLGETKTRRIHVKFIAASNIPLSTVVNQEKFRNDLWQRLREAEIYLPPLRERQEEIGHLVAHFCAHMPGGPYRIESTAMEVLKQLPWKSGNVRELRNCLRAMTEHHRHGLLTPLSIPERILQDALENPHEVHRNYKKRRKKSLLRTKALRPKSAVVLGLLDTNQALRPYDTLCDELLFKILDFVKSTRHKINVSGLAKELKVSRSTLQLKIKTKKTVG